MTYFLTLSQVSRSVVLNWVATEPLGASESSTAGLGNIRPAGHMQPTKHLYVARELF